MTMTPYIEEILSQPEVLHTALERYDFQRFKELANSINRGEFDRIILTGMGASYYSLVPAWIRLVQLGLPAILVDTAELIHYVPGALTPKTLLWVVSQSGRTAEMIPLMDAAQFGRGMLIATVNDEDSPVARAADLSFPIYAPVELTTSTRTYLNTLAVNQFIAAGLSGEPLTPIHEAYLGAVESIRSYFQHWRQEVDFLKTKIGIPEHLVFLGRGISLGSAGMGALVLQEAAKFPAWSLSTAQFRHGPIEMADERLTAIVFAGSRKTAELNLRLLKDLLDYRVKGFWAAMSPQSEIPNLLLPSGDEICLPVFEAVFVQLLSIALAELSGIEAGKFNRIGKITLSE